MSSAAAKTSTSSAAAAVSDGSIYTTIPISTYDVLSRSFQNFSAAVSRHRPWPEFVAAGVFARPESLSDAYSRASLSAAYFRVNYAVVLAACAALSLIGSPFTLVLAAVVFLLWPVLYLHREDPIFVYDRHVTDRMVLVGLFLVTILTLWLGGIAWNLIVGVGIGALICSVHGAFRNPEGLYIDDPEAASDSGLYGSRSAPGYDVVG